MSNKNVIKFQLLPVAAAILLAYSPAYAEVDKELQALMSPESFVSVGVAGQNSGNDAIRFSQYTGLNQSGSVILDGAFNKRDDATGLWTTFSARNLGLDTRELSFSQNKQGDWKYQLDYNEIVRRDPYVIHTGMTGIGTATPTINLIAQPNMPAPWATANLLVAPVAPAAARDVELKLKRTALGVSGNKWLTSEMQVEVSFRTENKKGARLFGRAGLDSGDMSLRPTAGTGVTNWAILLTPEPIDSNTQQLEAKLNYLGSGALALTGGYYGSFYVNNNGSLSPVVPGTLNRGVLWNGGPVGSSTVQQLASSAVALPPDNQAHQLYLSGNYAFSDTTRSNFKAAYTHATQNESFVGMGLTPAASAPANLGGVVDTKLLQVGLTMRPMKNLSVNSSLRYEDRADKTPVYIYNTNGTVGNALNNTTNWGSGSQTRTSAKLDGIYRFDSGYSVTLGGDWERKATPLPPANTALFANQVLFRPVLNEYGIHTEVRKALSDTLNGAIGLEYKERRGKDTDWVTTTGTLGNALIAFNPGAAAGNRVLPQMYMDKIRTKVRANLDWEATERLSLQTVLEHSQDNFQRAAPVLVQVVPTIAGPRTVISDSLSLDSTYTVSETWRINGYVTRSYNRWNVNKASLGDDTKNIDDTLGVAVNGKLSSNLLVGIDVMATRDITTFNNKVATSNVGGAGNIAGFAGQPFPGNYLPNINYRTKKLNMHGKYLLDKVSEIKVTFIYQQFKTDDWQWGYNGVPFLYSDNTTVSQPMSQNLRFIGASYQLNF